MVAISHINNQPVLIIILKNKTLTFIDKVFLKLLLYSRQIKETNINQINAMLYLLALSPFVAP